MVINEIEVVEHINRGEKIICVNMDRYQGRIPRGYDLVEYESNSSPMNGSVLYGFDEVGEFASCPLWAFVKVA